MKEKIFKLLENSKLLIIIDNLEDTLRQDEIHLRTFLDDLFTKAAKLAILSTSRQKIRDLGETIEKVIELDPQTNEQSIELLLEKSRDFTSSEIYELFKVPL